MTSPHVMVLGLRGFPDIQGGVETHCENLCPLVAASGFRVTVLGRARYLRPEHPVRWKGVELVGLWSPASKQLEAVVHSLMGALYAGIRRPDVLHIHAIGPALVAPLARLLGLRVVVTHHGPDYDRQKWGPFAKRVLRCGEALGMRFAHRRIAISETIRGIVTEKYRVESTLIPNGVSLPDLPGTRTTLARFGLEPGRYVLLVSRLVPEKRHLDLIAAFAAAELRGWKLALVGGSDHPDAYSRSVEDGATRTPGVVMTGVQKGTALAELYGHAGVFVLPSAHEGLPIVLLEALSYGLPVIASDIPANLEVGLPAEHYFRLGDIDGLVERLRRFCGRPLLQPDRRATQSWVVERYDWNQIARQTVATYRSALGAG